MTMPRTAHGDRGSTPRRGGLEISLEIFPPKTPAGASRLWDTIARLRPLAPRYVSVTCGAGGNPAEGTADLVREVRARAGLDAAAHLTCASTPRDEVDRLAERYWAEGVRHLVALRGDPPKDRRDLSGHYPYAVELVRALRRLGDLEISVAAYPETHPEALSSDRDLANLKAKIDAGADRAITQYCFDTTTVLRFRDRMVRAGIGAPLVVGVVPIHDFAQIRRFSERCGAGVPDWLDDAFARAGDDPERRLLAGARIAADQIRTLAAEGLTRIHFYTLNRAEPTALACRILGIGALDAAA